MSKPKPPSKPRRVPPGPAISWTDADLDQLSTITPDDATQAADWWRRNADKPFVTLLDATVDDGGSGGGTPG